MNRLQDGMAIRLDPASYELRVLGLLVKSDPTLDPGTIKLVGPVDVGNTADVRIIAVKGDL